MLKVSRILRGVANARQRCPRTAGIRISDRGRICKSGGLSYGSHTGGSKGAGRPIGIFQGKAEDLLKILEKQKGFTYYDAKKEPSKIWLYRPSDQMSQAIAEIDGDWVWASSPQWNVTMPSTAIPITPKIEPKAE